MTFHWDKLLNFTTGLGGPPRDQLTKTLPAPADVFRPAGPLARK